MVSASSNAKLETKPLTQKPVLCVKGLVYTHDISDSNYSNQFMKTSGKVIWFFTSFSPGTQVFYLPYNMLLRPMAWETKYRFPLVLGKLSSAISHWGNWTQLTWVQHKWSQCLFTKQGQIRLKYICLSFWMLINEQSSKNEPQNSNCSSRWH